MTRTRNPKNLSLQQQQEDVDDFKQRLKNLEVHLTKTYPTHQETTLLLLAANNNEPIPSLTHLATEMIFADKCIGGLIPFKSWILENEKGRLYNELSAFHEHEEDVL